VGVFCLCVSVLLDWDACWLQQETGVGKAEVSGNGPILPLCPETGMTGFSAEGRFHNPSQPQAQFLSNIVAYHQDATTTTSSSEETTKRRRMTEAVNFLRLVGSVMTHKFIVSACFVDVLFAI
jgi:hypothetical protein